MVNTASRVGSINVLLAVQFGQATAGLNTFAGTVEKTGARTQRAVSGIDRSVLSMNRSMSSIASHASGFRGLTISALRTKDSLGQLNAMMLAMSALLGGLLPTLTGAYFVRMADRARLLSNDLQTVTKSTAELKGVQADLFHVSQRSRAGFESTATIYARTARATEFLSLSQEKLLRMTETIQKAFAVGKATPQEAMGAAIQLSQGIASNRFSGEEFRSVAENAPVLLRGIADSLGVNIGKLREMAHAGELTAEVVVNAIVDASQRIDAEFSKTTSTIAQSMVYLDNAILKYVGDSQNVSATSTMIANSIRGMADSIDYVAEGFLALGAAAVATFGGRITNSIAKSITAKTAYLAMQKKVTAAGVGTAQVELLNAQRLKASTAAAYEMAKASTVSASTRARLGRQLQASYAAELVAQKNLKIATEAYGNAVLAASTKGRAFAAVGRAAGAAWAFIGGPFGAAMLAIGGALYITQRAAAQAQADMDRFSTAMQDAKDKADGAEPSFQSVADSMYRIAQASSAAEKAVALDTASNDLERFSNQMYALGSQANGVAKDFSGNLYRSIRSLIDQFLKGEITAKEFGDAVQNIETSDPDVSAILVRIASIGKMAAAAMAAVESLKSSVAGIGDPKTTQKTNRLGYPDPLSDGNFDSRFGQQYNKSWDKLFPDWFKKGRGGRGGSTRKRADEYERLTKRIRESTEATRLETQVQAGLNPLVNDYGYAVEKARTQQELLNAAKAAGRTITPALMQEINALAESYAMAGAEADKLKEKQDKLKEAMKFQKDLLKGFFSDFRSALEDGKITAEEWGNIFMNVINKVTDKLINDLLDSFLKVNGGVGNSTGSIIGSLFSMFAGGGKSDPWAFLNRADGGMISGRGGPREDNIPVWASNGEFMVNARATRKYLPLLKAINEDQLSKMRRFADGGIIASNASSMPSTMPRGGSTTINVIDNAGVSKKTSKRRDGNGNEIIDVVLEAVKSDWSNGGFDQAVAGRHGVLPKKVRR